MGLAKMAESCPGTSLSKLCVLPITEHYRVVRTPWVPFIPIMLPGRRCLFERSSRAANELSERLRGEGHDAGRVFTKDAGARGEPKYD
jgi:hypothetical protein